MLSHIRQNMRAKTVTHVEYEALNLILNEITVDELREDMVPEGDEVALKRFYSGVTNVANLVQNMANRRRHRLPESHRDFRVKDE